MVKKDLKNKKIILKAFRLGLYSCTKDGIVFSHKSSTEKPLSQCTNSMGYVTHILMIDGRRINVLAHHAIILFFNKNASFVGKCTNHIDTNRANNKLENLEIVTQKQNILHARNLGRLNTSKGEDHFRSRLKVKDVLEIREMISRSENIKTIASKFNVGISTIADIKRGATWKHVS